MRKRTTCFLFSWLLLLGLGPIALAQQQQDRRSFNYGFVSPNTREDLKVEEAIEGMSSPAETNLIKHAVNLGCVVRSKVSAVKALGSWSDGAEYSVMLRVKSDKAAVRYLLSRLGREAQQKSVLYFNPQPAGPAIIYTLKPQKNVRNLVALGNTLERAGIAFRTLVPRGKTTWIYIVDLKRELRTKVMTAAKRLNARVSAEPGDAAFVGDDDATRAKVVFEEEIKGFEKAHPNLPPTCDRSKRR